jgi:hypothetical protein
VSSKKHWSPGSVRVVALLRDLGLRMIMIDEVHNLLAGTHREQRRFLNVLRYLSNELEVSLVCLGVSEAVDAIRGDIQLARRLDEHHLPNWEKRAKVGDAQFRLLVKAAISSSDIDDYARVAQLRAFEKESRLLAAVDHIARQRAKSIGPMATESHN